MTVRLLLVLMLMVGVHPVAGAEPESAPENDLKRAVVFGFDGLDISGFQGGFGYKTWIGATSAVVLGLEFGYNETSEDAPDDDEHYPDTETSRDNIGIYIELQKHFAGKKPLSPYAGVAFEAGWTGSSSSRTYPDQSDIPIYKRTSDMFTIAPGVLLGFEFFLRPDISLSAQSSLGVRFGWGSEETNDGYEITEFDNSEFDLRIGTSRLLLTVYF